MLIKPPSSIGQWKDPLDRAAIKILASRLTDSLVEMRRDATVGLLRVARHLKRRAPNRAKRLVRLVRQAIRREKNATERFYLRRRVRVLWGR
jgi:hypothetical protein